MRIGILNTDTLKTEFDTKYGQYPAMFRNVLLQADPNIQIHSYEVQFGDYPATLDECDAYLITGSKVSAYDDIPWINELKIFVRALHQHQKKLIGICFGHQLIAEALGGKVERSKGGWHVGVHGATLKKKHCFIWKDSPRIQSYLQSSRSSVRDASGKHFAGKLQKLPCCYVSN